MLELPTTNVAELFQAGPDVVDDPAVQELREEILHRCVAMQANLSQRLEEKRTSLDALCGVTADDFRAEIAQECLAFGVTSIVSWFSGTSPASRLRVLRVQPRVWLLKELPIKVLSLETASAITAIRAIDPGDEYMHDLHRCYMV